MQPSTTCPAIFFGSDGVATNSDEAPVDAWTTVWTTRVQRWLQDVQLGNAPRLVPRHQPRDRGRLRRALKRCGRQSVHHVFNGDYVVVTFDDVRPLFFDTDGVAAGE